VLIRPGGSCLRLRPCGSAWGGRPASGGKNLVISVV